MGCTGNISPAEWASVNARQANDSAELLKREVDRLSDEVCALRELVLILGTHHGIAAPEGLLGPTRSGQILARVRAHYRSHAAKDQQRKTPPSSSSPP